jgi:pilus assembly protein CpaE
MSIQSTLLPEARVDVFAADPATAEVAARLNKDWRFARVRVTVHSGDIATAIQKYAQEKSPDLIMIETNQIDSSFTGQLEALANVCATHTAAIFIGPENDIGLYRRLLEMGATDYLVRPLNPDDMVGVIGKTLLERLGTSESRVVSVMGVKGGVGTSRIAQLIAHGISQHTAVTLLDCGGTWGLFSTTYGREPMITLRDLATLVRTQADALDDLLHTVAPNLSWVATGGDPLLNSTLTSDGLEGIIDTLTRRHPNIVMDLSQSATGIRAMAFAKSHHIVLVTTATPLALRNTRLMLKEIHQLRGSEAPVHLVINQSGLMPKEELSLKDIQQALGLTPVVQLPFQPDDFSKLDTANPQPAIALLNTMADQVAPLLYALTGKQARHYDRGGSATSNEGTSFLNRLLKRG